MQLHQQQIFQKQTDAGRALNATTDVISTIGIFKTVW